MRAPTAILSLTLVSCGYTFGTGLAAHGVQTIAVRVVANQTFRQGLEVPLTAAIHERMVLADLTPASHGDADAILEVTLTDDRGRSLVTGSRSDPVREGSIQFTALVRLVDRRTGRPLVDRRILDRAEYRTPLGESLASAQQELVSDLARKIVLALETGF